MTDGFDDGTAYGFVDGLDDPSMGWARYAQSTKHMNLNSGLFYVRANVNTVALMSKLADRLSKHKYWDQTAFNEEIFFLSHGSTSFVPISVRVMDYWIFQNSKVRQLLQLSS
jgi:arabinosyltransferase